MCLATGFNGIAPRISQASYRGLREVLAAPWMKQLQAGSVVHTFVSGLCWSAASVDLDEKTA